LKVIETVRQYMEEDYGVAKEDEKVRPPKSQRLEEKGTELNPRESRPINSLQVRKDIRQVNWNRKLPFASFAAATLTPRSSLLRLAQTL